MLNFSNKNILLCVTGGIAAYKAAEIIRLFKKDGAGSVPFSQQNLNINIDFSDSSKSRTTDMIPNTARPTRQVNPLIKN